MAEDRKPLRIVGGVEDAKAEYQRLLDQAKASIAANDLSTAYNLLHDAETLAFQNKLFDEAANCRKAVSALRAGKVPCI